MNLIPRPRQLTAREGGFTIDARTTISASTEAKPIADLLRQQFGPAMGFRLIDALTAGADDGRPARADGAVPGIRMTVDPTIGPGPESYRLEVSPTGIELVGRDAAGLFYASQTLRQLLPAAIFGEARSWA